MRKSFQVASGVANVFAQDRLHPTFPLNAVDRDHVSGNRCLSKFKEMAETTGQMRYVNPLLLLTAEQEREQDKTKQEKKDRDEAAGKRLELHATCTLFH